MQKTTITLPPASNIELRDTGSRAQAQHSAIDTINDTCIWALQYTASILQLSRLPLRLPFLQPTLVRWTREAVVSRLTPCKARVPPYPWHIIPPQHYRRGVTSMVNGEGMCAIMSPPAAPPHPTPPHPTPSKTAEDDIRFYHRAERKITRRKLEALQ